ncbi:MAG: hypothetical protein NVV62_14615 [Terricaulis sp.]|nr:hypothetical protein [Terricaulis sp.]
MLRLAAALIFAALMAAPSATAQDAPAALAQAIALTDAANAPYAFDIELESSRMQWRARFQPEASPRVRLIAPAREDLTSDQRRAFDRFADSTEGVSWCASTFLGRIADVRLVREDEASAHYTFQPTRESIRSADGRRYAQHMRGEFTLNKANADITRMRIHAPAAFDAMPLVRVERFSLTIDCALAPNGRRFAAQTVTELQGRAFGQNFGDRTIQRAANLSAP